MAMIKRTVNGTEYSLTKIGKGTWCEVYRIEGTDNVMIFAKDGDVTKESIALYADKKNPHIPKFEKLGVYDTPRNSYYVYLCPFYNKLTAAHTEAWKTYKLLNKALLQANKECTLSFDHIDHYVNRNSIFIEKLREYNFDSETIPETVIAALEEEILYCIENYFRDIQLEFNRGNLAVDDDGNLILLDVVFSVNAARKAKGQRPMIWTDK